MPDTLLPLTAILLGWLIAGGSPGPATLTISGTSMEYGRRAGLSVALGVVAGSACWGVAAAVGLSAVMIANAWVLELVRYMGALYLLWLAFKSLRAAWRGDSPQPLGQGISRRRLFARGLLLHLTNPKAVLGWGAVYAISLPEGAGPGSVWALFLWLIATSAVVFLGYACIFSTPAIARGYLRAKRWFDLAFGLLFGAASVKILTVRLQ